MTERILQHLTDNLSRVGFEREELYFIFADQPRPAIDAALAELLAADKIQEVDGAWQVKFVAPPQEKLLF